MHVWTIYSSVHMYVYIIASGIRGTLHELDLSCYPGPPAPLYVYTCIHDFSTKTINNIIYVHGIKR